MALADFKAVFKEKKYNNGYCVLLCTQNGAAYLSEQLESIFSQTIKPASIFIFDDQSIDNTLTIASSFCNRLPITFVNLKKHRSGAAGAFAAILSYAAEFPVIYENYFLCDQDDIWSPCKAEKLIKLLERVPQDAPGLVHSELSCFGNSAGGRLFLHNSLGHVNFESTPSHPLTTIILENIVVGASSAFNAKLLEYAVPMPTGAFMHDWWLAIACVGNGGFIYYHEEPLVRYRIHNNSSIGRSGNFIYAFPRRIYAIRQGFRDPWLKVVSGQLMHLPFGQDNLPDIFFKPLLNQCLWLINEPSFYLRYRAWLNLSKSKIWAVFYKDVYYKFRLFTDYVIRWYVS